jgi:hypothetical protein
MRTSIEKFKSRVDLRQEQGSVTYWTFRHISNAKREGSNNKIISGDKWPFPDKRDK